MFLILIILLPIKIYFDMRFIEPIICRSPNDFMHIFAPPGTGKTTLAAKIVREGFLENKKVYSNVPIRGALRVDLKDLGSHMYRDCKIIIDEAGSELSNRSWHSNLSKSQIDFIKKHRHYNVDIYVFSQAYGDVDNKFRELTTKLLMLKKSKIPFYVYAMCIRKVMDLVNGQIVEFYEWNKAESFRFFTPPTWAWFNSYDIDETKPLPKHEYYTQIDCMNKI